ncbi:MAG: undecaprenyl-phosphate galactose phosphotransferase WbaP [Desulfoplanes sp.]|jgi:Undecaprenyl-phosphate galactose phosphotransferase WbaP|nr:undecaprenyl-phosphate galactose phosphotransferase WbaP [Desulfoplanes sp.]
MKKNSMMMPVALLISDIVALCSGGILSVWMRYILEGQFSFAFYGQLWPLIFLFLFVYSLAGLYPGILHSPPEELKRASQATSFCFVLLAVIVFLFKGSDLYSRGIFFLAWISFLILIPVFRAATRSVYAHCAWWGYPTVIFGAGVTGSVVVNTLLLRPRLGVRPLAIVDDDPAKQGQYLKGIPVVGGLEMALELSKEWKNALAILAMPGLRPEKIKAIIEDNCQYFRRIILVPDLFGFSSLWVNAIDFGGILGLDVVQKLIDPKRQAFKRYFDLVFICISLPVLVPLFLLLALAVSVDSRGPVFFKHKRIGMGGKEFFVWKFRTMIQDADKVLATYLTENPDLREEWEQTQKLQHDPRITRLGRILRKTSLDELPQLWNVIKGELSLVGPRPIVQDEVEKYQEAFSLYKKVRPGITGLWQVSGRSDTSYDQRVNLDTYYVRNWSIWFDIYILALTPRAVLSGHGAC